MGNRGEGGRDEGERGGRVGGSMVEWKEGEGGVREGRKFQSSLRCPNTSGSTE